MSRTEGADERVLRRNIPIGRLRQLHATHVYCAACNVRNGATLAESAHLCSIVTTPDNMGLAPQRFFATRAKEFLPGADIKL